MSQLIETICVDHGEIRNIVWHQKRFDLARYKIFGCEEKMDLLEIISQVQFDPKNKLKCRIVYDTKINSITFDPYQIRKIDSIQLVENDLIDYRYKLENRKAFDLLKDNLEADEIIIVKNGKITDSSFSNIIFYDGNQWFTPRTFLLNGTMRQFLLSEKMISEIEIGPEDLPKFQAFKLINAMLNFEESPTYNCTIIR